MEIDDVHDHSSLERYVSALPSEKQRNVCLRVASNAAVRVLPIATQTFLPTTLPRGFVLRPQAIFHGAFIFGAVSLSCCALLDSNRDIAPDISTATDTYLGTSDEYGREGNDAYDNSDFDTAAAFGAAVTSLSAASAALLTSDYAYHAANIANSAAFACDAAGVEIDYWSLVRLDLSGNNEIWPDWTSIRIAERWDKAKQDADDHPADWSIWVKWYELVVMGRNWHPEAMYDVLKDISDEDWGKGPTHINPMFDEVLALYNADEEAAVARQKSQE